MKLPTKLPALFVYEEARSARHAIFSMFDWDDSEEGFDYWRDVVRRIDAYCDLAAKEDWQEVSK